MIRLPLILVLIYFVQLGHFIAQNPHPYFRNYTTADGLPSPAVHYCLEDEQGFMWFATDNGLSRFDGYEFRNFSNRDGLKDNTVFYLQTDPEGRVWAATIHGNLYYMENDSIHAFAQNDVIRQHSRGTFIVTDFFIAADGVKYLSIYDFGILAFLLDGSHRIVKAQTPFGNVFAMNITGRWMNGITAYTDSDMPLVREKYWSKKRAAPLELHSDSVAVVKGVFHRNFEGGSSEWVKRFQNNRLFAFGDNYLFEIRDDSIIWSGHFPFHSQYKIIREEADGSILIGNPTAGGLRRYRDTEQLKAGVHEQFLEGKSPSHIFKDSEGGYWISTVDNGVFYCPDFEGKIYDRSAELPVDYVSALAFKNDRELYLGLRNGQVFHLDLLSDKLTPLPPAPDAPNIFDMAYDEQRQELWIATGRNAWFNNGRWGQVFHRMKNGNEGFVFGKQLTIRKGSDTFWGNHSMMFAKIDLSQKACVLHSLDLGIEGRFNVVWEDAAGRVWAGMSSGLFEFKNNKLRAPQPFHTAFGAKVSDLAELPDGTLVVATKGEGVLLWKGDFFHQITTADGLTSDLIENVHADEQGNIWAGTLAGLNKISPQDSVWQVKQITVRHGLPSNEIHQVRSRTGQVWVATSKGLVRLPEIKFNPDSPVPHIESALAGRRPLDPAAPARISFWENNLTIHFTAINYRMNGRIPYRFRLDGGDWTATQNRSVNFPSLPSGQRLFEVQAQNEDGVWSETAAFRFTIRPPWWATWWAVCSAIAVVAAFVFGVYKYRTGQLKKEIALQKQLALVERQALRSQMNPHFLFNALNAIQGYIADGDKAAANRYLSRFSRLVRAALHHSRLTQVPLEDELRNLENYLELERMRFHEMFDYRITVAGNLNPADITLPPMLVQPFLENAILHGLSKKEGKGQLDLDFRLENGSLLVTVTDNGIGIEQSQRLKKESGQEHQSVGMSITARRLEMLGGESGRVETEELKDEEGQAAGTKVRVWVPLES